MNLKRLLNSIAREPRAVGPAVRYAAFQMREKRKYQRWIKRHTLTDPARAAIIEEIDSFGRRPLISILLPVYNVDERWLRLCLASVTRQLYPFWELCIADDNSPSPHIRKVLDEFAAADERIKIVYRSENGNISAASNTALEMADGEFAVLLDHDDELSEDALFRVVSEINQHPATDLLYSDEDKIDERGRRCEPKFKPDWSRDLFYSLNLVTHLSCFRTEILRTIGGFRKGYEGSQDYDLALRFIEQTDERRIRHIPRVLYHWRAISGSVALSGGEKPYAHERARGALRGHFERARVEASVETAFQNMHRVRYKIPDAPPLVRLIVFGSKRSVGSLETDYANCEIVDAGVRETADELNRAVFEARSEIVCFVRSGLVPASRDWLEELVSFALQPNIGAVGGKIIYKDGSVLFGGAIINSHGSAAAHRGFPSDAPGQLSRNVLIGNFASVSINCMAVRREIFVEAGGFASAEPPTLFDADLCLRLGTSGYRTVFTPYAVLKSEEKLSEAAASKSELKFFTTKWAAFVEHDPFHNPNLSKGDGSFSIDL